MNTNQNNEVVGKAWVFGDDIDTDLLAPGIYMKGPFEELVNHCLESVDPTFATKVQPGDVIVAGKNFGIGSSREQAAQALKHLGVDTIIARSFGGIFFRNAVNWGLVAVQCEDTSNIQSGHQVLVEPEIGKIINITTGDILACDPIPPMLMKMVRDGGLVSHLENTRAASNEEKH